VSILSTYLAETLTGRLPSLNHEAFRGPYADAHGPSVYLVSLEDEDWICYATPGWEGSTCLEIVVERDGDVVHDESVEVEWTGGIDTDAQLWEDAVCAFLGRLTPANAPGWRSTTVQVFHKVC